MRKLYSTTRWRGSRCGCRRNPVRLWPRLGKRPSARATRNPNLKVGKVTDRDTYFEVEILTKEDSLADKLAVYKNTGWIRPIY